MYFVRNRTGHSEEKHTNTKKAKGTFYMSKRSSNRSLDNTTRNVQHFIKMINMLPTRKCMNWLTTKTCKMMKTKIKRSEKINTAYI